ncbi:MAG: glycosyltransferase [Bryobacteraceae bacterium]
MTSADFRYLLVTHIPFARSPAGHVVVDSLWARDLQGLVSSIGPIRVAAPEMGDPETLETWGPSSTTLDPGSGIEFAGFPAIAARTDYWKWLEIRSVLSREVKSADLVHTSNFFSPYVPLTYAHDLAVRLGKKTLFVIAEDFHDMLEWEWVRMGGSPLERWRRHATLEGLDRRVRRTAASASLTFLHTPAAVSRYRLNARRGVAIRQPGHERCDVIDEARLQIRCAALENGAPLRIVAACRHKPLKGLDFLIASIARLAEAGVRVEASIFGQGESTGSLQSLTARLGLAGSVTFPGALEPGAAVYDAIAQAHIFAMPHRTTDFGRAFFDAMAGGAPVLAFRSPASQDTVRHEVDGLLAPPDDVEGLAAAIQRFHDDRQLLIRASWSARSRALLNTRSAWYRWRAEWIRSLFEAEAASAA